MKCTILHDLPGRLRVHLCCGRMSLSQADVLEYYLRAQDGVQDVKVYDRTQDAVVVYNGTRGDVIAALASFSFAKAEGMELVPEHTSRELNREFEDKLAIPHETVRFQAVPAGTDHVGTGVVSLCKVHQRRIFGTAP
mgnify:CR=1 FL=1